MTADIFLQRDSKQDFPTAGSSPDGPHFFVSPLQLGCFGACNYYFPRMVNFGRASRCKLNGTPSSLLLFLLYFKKTNAHPVLVYGRVGKAVAISDIFCSLQICGKKPSVPSVPSVNVSAATRALALHTCLA